MRLASLYPPEALAQTLAVARRCGFSLDELRYEYPDEIVPPGHTPATYLRRRRRPAPRAASRRACPRRSPRRSRKSWA